jgi:hypothetical protein
MNRKPPRPPLAFIRPFTTHVFNPISRLRVSAHAPRSAPDGGGYPSAVSPIDQAAAAGTHRPSWR